MIWRRSRELEEIEREKRDGKEKENYVYIRTYSNNSDKSYRISYYQVENGNNPLSLTLILICV